MHNQLVSFETLCCMRCKYFINQEGYYGKCGLSTNLWPVYNQICEFFEYIKLEDA